MQESRFQLANGDRNVGSLYLPEGPEEALPVLVVCHGWPGDRQPYPFTEALCTLGTRAGMAVVTFDFYGSGETGGDRGGISDGRWATNLADVCAYVGTRPWADAGRIAALGISTGSTAVLRCMLDSPLLAGGISVATCLGHYIRMGKGAPAKLLVDNLDLLLAGGTIDLYGYPCGLAFFKDFIGGAPIYRLRAMTRPVLFLQGAADNAFRLADARLGYEMLRSEGLPASYREIAAGDHGLGNVALEGARAALDWLREIAILR